jgi:hypothetical protein
LALHSSPEDRRLRPKAHEACEDKGSRGRLLFRKCTLPPTGHRLRRGQTRPTAGTSDPTRRLEHLGHDVTFAYVPYEDADFKAMEKRLGHRLRILQAQSPPFESVVARVKRKIKRKLGLASAHIWDVDEWFDDDLIPQVITLQNAESFETVLIEHVFLSKLASIFPTDVRTVIDTHKIFGDLHKRYLKNGLNPNGLQPRPRKRSVL